MKYIWSPWRMAYIQKHKEEARMRVLRSPLGMNDGPDNLILYRGQESFVILNRYPYTSGHHDGRAVISTMPSLEGLEVESSGRADGTGCAHHDARS